MTLTVLAAAWVAGLLLGMRAALPIEALALWSIAAAALGSALAWQANRRELVAPVCAAALLLAAGAWWGGRAAGHDVDAGLRPLFLEEQVTLRGVVLTDPERDGTAYRFQIGALQRDTAEGWRPIDGRVQVTAQPGAAMAAQRGAPHVRYGDRLTLTGGVESPPVFDDFDYREYLARQGVGAVARFPSLAIDAESEGNLLLNRVYALRATLAESLQRTLPEPASALARSLLLGQRRGLPEPVREAFIETGTSHLLAISGLHVTIMLAAALALGRLAFGGARWALLLAFAAVWAYALVSGMSPSVTRAAVMGSVFLLARALGREGAGLPALAAAAAGMTALDPRVLGSVSFQLSFTAVAGLLLLAPPLEARLARAAERVTGDDGPTAALGRATAAALAAGIAATLGTLPLVALVFERVSYLGIPVTLLALPALPLALALSGVAALAGVVWAPLGIAVGWLAWAPLTYLLALVDAAARLPGGLLPVGGFTPAMVWACYALLAAAAYALRRWHDADAESSPPRRPSPSPRGRLRLAVIPMLLACAVVWTAAVTAPGGRLTVTFLDVGQGDAIFIETPSGAQILIDGGPDPEVLHRELGEVMPFWDRSIDLVVLTHPDADHLNGLVTTLERYDVALVAETGIESTSAQYASWRRLLAQRPGAAIIHAHAGQTIHTPGSVVISVLNPPPDLPPWTPDIRNNSAVTLRVVYRDVTFLLPADIHAYAERAIVASGAPLTATVLKAAHHGSATSSTQTFLDAVQPEFIVVSAGADNKFGHPAPEVVQRLEAAVGEENVYVTAQHGRVQFTTDGERLWRDTER